MALPAEWTRFAPKPRPLTGNEQWNVFLSYRSVNRSWVLNLYDVLVQQGHKVFLDQCVLKAGDELIMRLEESLNSSQAGVLIWSSATRDSEWVRREYQVMERLSTKKPTFSFVPVNLDGSELPVFAESKVFLDFSGYPDGPNGGELLRLLHAIVQKPLTEDAVRFANEQDEAAKATVAKIQAAIKNKSPARLVDLFQAGGLPWATSASLGCRAAEGLTRLDRNDDAIGVLEKLEAQFPKAVRPKQLRALALARRGRGDDLEIAQEIVGTLYQAGERDPETLGIYARTWMDRYNKSGDVGDLRQSRDLYAEAFESARDDYYTGINAASKSVLIGTDEDIERGASLAQRVEEIVGRDPKQGDYWQSATVGEVQLLQKNYASAARAYSAAVAMARSEAGSHRSTWKQACLLMAKLRPSPTDRASIRKAFDHLPECDQL